jgi:hypothetical protein
LQKVGQKIQCPDCYSENVVPEPPLATETRGPTLDDAPTFSLSDVVARPAYRPLVAPRGEDAILAAFERPHVPTRSPHPDEVQMQLPTGGRSAEDTELTLAPPEERLAVEPLLPVTAPPEEPEDPLYDGRYDDGLVDDHLDPADPQAWRRAPLMLGIVGFLLTPPVWPRWAAYAVGLTLLEAMFRVVSAAAAPGSPVLAAVPLVLPMVCVLVFVWMINLAVTLMTVMEGTANSGDEISEWPTWDLFRWFWPSLQLAAALLVGAVPGLAIASLLLVEGGGRLPEQGGLDWPRLAIPVLLSWWLLLPPLLYSMLTEASLVRMLSPLVLHSFRQVPDAWLLYYLMSLVLLLPLAGGLALMQAESWWLVLLGALVVTGCLLVAARLLGRLMWYCNQRVDLPAPAQ